ncbi:lactate racemase domain-containing protein [Candidatus Solincola sp.]|nr:lactate racemase domain-containing protein [Actinomycetota bacterium]
MRRVSLPNLLWYGNQALEVYFPDRWEVEVLEPPGFGKPPLDDAGVERAFREPIGCPPLEELASGAREVVIVFDDITRPTPVSRVLPWILRPLEEAGIPDANIRFIPALGMHGAMNNIDFRKKLGPEVVEKFPIYNHNPYENCEYLGDSPTGVPVYINREFMYCDLRIGIGCITPHVHVGFGGGGKIILPGISGVQTIKAWHGEVSRRGPETMGLGRTEGNVMYEEIKHVVRMSGLQVKVDALINARGEITDLFVGDPLEEYAVGIEAAREHYGTPPSPGKDIVVANAYAKYNEMAICMLMSMMTVNLQRGVIVLVVNAPEGQVCHYLIRSFGKEYGGDFYMRMGPPPPGIKIIVCTAYPDRTMCDLFAPMEAVTVTRDWEETLQLLEREYPDRASVAVIPDGTMQFFKT